MRPGLTKDGQFGVTGLNKHIEHEDYPAYASSLKIYRNMAFINIKINKRMIIHCNLFLFGTNEI